MFKLTKKIKNFFKKLKIFLKKTNFKKKTKYLDEVSLRNKDLYESKITNYIDYKKNEKKYNELIKKYSKLIINNKLLVSINETKTLDIKKYDVEIRNLSKYFLIEKKIHCLFFNLNLKIKKGDFVVILGPSGSGKTSLLNIMSGLDNADSGDVFVKGYNLSLIKNSDLTKFRRENIGLIFQRYNLLQNLTARENVEIGANLLPKYKKSIDIDEILNVLEIKHLENSFIYQLSGGEQQRFSIARALAKNPCVLFCDEPTGALDQKTSEKVIDTLIKINEKYNTTIILITHDEKITKVAKTIINIKDGEINLIKNNDK